MNRIREAFQKLKRMRRKAVIFYITSGFPSLKGTEQLIAELQRRGTDLIEVGVPFSDPLADGPTIQGASVAALRRGVNLTGILRLIRRIRRRTHIPIVLFTYYNPVYVMGLERFALGARRAGVDGVIVPDLPPEEGSALSRALARRGIELIYLLSPTSSPKRIRMIAKKSRGFIYYVSRTGVTGTRSALDQSLSRHVQRVKKQSRLPVVIGFGVSNPSQAACAAQWADGVVIGSALVKRIENARHRSDWLKTCGQFAASITRAVKKVR